MPWHKARFYYDHSTGYRQRLLHRLDLSILLATALLLVTALGAMGSLDPAPGAARMQPRGIVHMPHFVESALSLADVQQICGVCAILCAMYLVVALFLRSRS
jgi:hypothetical protein